ncbi:transposase family protein [Streptomyces sp. NPDC002516]
MFAYAEAEGIKLRIDGTDMQVCRPGRKAFVSGKKKQNTIKTTTFSEGQGHNLFSGVVQPGRMHDQTAVRTEVIAEQFCWRPKDKTEVDEWLPRSGERVSRPGQHLTDEAEGRRPTRRATRLA